MKYDWDDWDFDFNDGRGHIHVSKLTEEEAKNALCHILSYYLEMEDIRNSMVELQDSMVELQDSITEAHKKYK